MSNDALRAGGAFDILARLAGGIVSYIVVAVILLATSTKLGLLVLLGVPVLTLSLSVVIKPLQQRQREQREEVGQLTALGADTAAGLRVLRGVGGEQAFFDRYQLRSESVRLAGVRVATPQSTLDAAQVLLPGLFVVLVTWVGAHLAASGDITAGQLVAFYGYAGFLVIPLRTSAEAVEKITRALVGARRMLRVLAVERAVKEPVDPLPGAAGGRAAQRPRLRADDRARRPHLPRLRRSRRDEPARRPARPDRRRARGVLLGDTALDRLPLDVVRRRILVSEPDPLIFSGTLRSELDPWARSSDSEITDAIEVAAAEDVLVALPAGLDEVVDERGRSFSGGQRQRLVLARALLADAEILVLVEPTSAVDAHTEARIARQLHDFRAGKTTVVVSASPLVLDQADTVVLIADGKVQADGHAPGAPPHAPRLSRRRHPGGGRMTDLLPIAGTKEMRKQALELAGRHRRAMIGVLVLHALAAATGLVGPPLLGSLVQGLQTEIDTAADRPGRRDPGGLPRRADDPHLLRPPVVVRALRADVRRAARRLHAPRARAAALDRRAGRDRRPRLAHDRRRRRARAHDPVRDPRDVDRVRDRAPRRRRRRLGEPDRRAALPRRGADPDHRDALVPPLRPGRLPLGARRVRVDGRHRRRDGRRRPHRRVARPRRRSGRAGSTPTSPTPTPRSASRSGCARSGSRPSTSPTSCRSSRRSPGAAGSSPTGTPRSAR